MLIIIKLYGCKRMMTIAFGTYFLENDTIGIPQSIHLFFPLFQLNGAFVFVSGFLGTQDVNTASSKCLKDTAFF